MDKIRILHVSHNDLDGYGATILSKFCFNHNDVKLTTHNIETGNLAIRSFLAENDLRPYDLVIFTDLAMSESVYNFLFECYLYESSFEQKFVWIDHHQIIDSEAFKEALSDAPWYFQTGEPIEYCGTMPYGTKASALGDNITFVYSDNSATLLYLQFLLELSAWVYTTSKPKAAVYTIHKKMRESFERNFDSVGCLILLRLSEIVFRNLIIREDGLAEVYSTIKPSWELHPCVMHFCETVSAYDTFMFQKKPQEEWMLVNGVTPSPQKDGAEPIDVNLEWKLFLPIGSALRLNILFKNTSRQFFGEYILKYFKTGYAPLLTIGIRNRGVEENDYSVIYEIIHRKLTELSVDMEQVSKDVKRSLLIMSDFPKSVNVTSYIVVCQNLGKRDNQAMLANHIITEVYSEEELDYVIFYDEEGASVYSSGLNGKDASKLAAYFGGGGHKGAAGFSFESIPVEHFGKNAIDKETLIKRAFDILDGKVPQLSVSSNLFSVSELDQ